MFFQTLNTVLSVVRNFLLVNAFVYVVAPVTHLMIRNVIYDNYVFIKEKVSEKVNNVKENPVIKQRIDKVWDKVEGYGYDIAYNILYYYSYAELKSKKLVIFLEEKYPFVKVVRDNVKVFVGNIREAIYGRMYEEVLDFANIYKEAFEKEGEVEDKEEEKEE